MLRAALDDEVPMLGICLGHQLMAIACGGDAGATPGAIEVGLHEVRIDLTAATGDPLFGALPASVPAIEAHQGEVWELPPGAVPLASTAGCRYQAYRLGSCAWGVQFVATWQPFAARMLCLGYAGAQPLPARHGADLHARCGFVYG